MQRAKRPGWPPLPVELLQFLDSRKILAKDILVPAINFHSAPVSLGQHFSENIQLAVIRRARLLQSRILVKLSMGGGVISSVKIQIVFLLSVIGQRLIGNLTSSDAASVSKGGQENSVGGGALLEDFEHLFGPFVNERNRAKLNTDNLLGRSCVDRRRRPALSAAGAGPTDRTDADKVPAVKIGIFSAHQAILKPGPLTGEPKT